MINLSTLWDRKIPKDQRGQSRLKIKWGIGVKLQFLEIPVWPRLLLNLILSYWYPGALLFHFSINEKIAAKAVLVLYGFLVSPHYYITSDNYFVRIFFVVIVSIIVAADYKMFRAIFLQGKMYQVASIIFLLLIPVSLVVGIDWDYHKIMMLVIFIFGYYLYKLDYSFLQRRSSDRK